MHGAVSWPAECGTPHDVSSAPFRRCIRCHSLILHRHTRQPRPSPSRHHQDGLLPLSPEPAGPVRHGGARSGGRRAQDSAPGAPPPPPQPRLPADQQAPRPLASSRQTSPCSPPCRPTACPPTAPLPRTSGRPTPSPAPCRPSTPPRAQSPRRRRPQARCTARCVWRWLTGGQPWRCMHPHMGCTREHRHRASGQPTAGCSALPPPPATPAPLPACAPLPGHKRRQAQHPDGDDVPRGGLPRGLRHDCHAGKRGGGEGEGSALLAAQPPCIPVRGCGCSAVSSRPPASTPPPPLLPQNFFSADTVFAVAELLAAWRPAVAGC